MDSDLAKFALLAFATVCSICIVTGGVAFAVAFSKSPDQATKAVKTFFEGGNALRVATVFGVLGTTTVLLFANRLNDGALALMSGIAGYVLGGLNKGNSERPSKQELQ